MNFRGLGKWRIAPVLVALLTTTGWAAPDNILGNWLRDDGAVKIKFDRCGEDLCGTIIWLKSDETTREQVGERVFYDMKSNGTNNWATKVSSFDGEQVFSGRMTVSGDFLEISVCLADGFICISRGWIRSP
ncbi:MAG: DUF2147 domain-containing protein [Bradyrhizobium sp.]|nr:DUF2147 domain-containing protein [Bradyrhizobium sp.]